MSKSETFQELLKVCAEQTERLVSAAQDAHANSTGDEVKAEGKYDTRGTEASYLAAAQAEQAEKAQKGLEDLRAYPVRDFEYDEAIALGALVEIEQEGEISYYFLLPHGGGLTSEYMGFEVNVLTPEAPLFQELIGQKAGTLVDDLMILGVE